MAIGVSGTYTDVLFGADDFDEFEWVLTPNNDPSPAYYYWATQMGWTNPAGGYIGGGYTGMQNLGAGFDDKCVLFSVGGGALDAESDDPEAILADDFDGGDGWSTRIPYDWVVGRSYRFRVYRGTTAGDGQWWNAEVTDLTTSTTTQISRIKVPLAWDGINGYTIHFTERYSGATDDCADVEYVSADFTGERMNASTTPVLPVTVDPHYSGLGTCPNSDIAPISGGTRHRMGIPGDLATVAHTITTTPTSPTAGGVYKVLLTATPLVNFEPHSPYRNVITATIPTGLMSGAGANAAAASFRTRQVDGGVPGVWSSSTNIGTTGVARKSVTDWPTTRQHQIELTFVAGNTADDFTIETVVEWATADSGGTRTLIGDDTVDITVSVAPPAEAPGAPIAAATTATPTTVLINWAAPAETGGAPITGYNLYAAPDGNPLTLVTAVASLPTSFLFTGLVPDSTYKFAVEAVNSAGAGPKSNTVTESTLPEGDPPAAPVIAANRSTASTVRIGWAAPASPDWPILGYLVYQALAGESQTLIANIPAVTSFTFQGLAASTDYEVSLVPYNVVGEGERSNVLAVSTNTDAFAPDAPTIISAVADATSVTIRWSTPPNNGSAITGYKVYSAAHGDTLALTATLGVQSSRQVTGLTEGIAYDFAVVATNTNGDSAQSPVVTARTTSVPSAPTLVPSAVTTTSVMVQWQAPPPGGAPVTGYKVYGGFADGPQTLLDTIPGSATRYTFSGLAANTGYDFSIEAVNTVGASERSATLTRMTLASVPSEVVGDAEFIPFPGMPEPPPRYMKSRLWNEQMTGLIADLPDARTNHIEDIGDGVGGGGFVMAAIAGNGALDPLIANGSITGGRIVQTQVWDEDDETYLGAYLWRIEDKPHVTIAPNTGQLVISPAGRGVAQDFETSQVDPFGGVDRTPWSDIRSFGWQAPELRDDLAPWTAPNVRSVQALKTALPPYGLGGKPYGWPNPLSPWLWGVAPSGGADAVGFSYFRYRFTLNATLDVTFYVTADDLFVASLNDVDIIDFQADKGDAAGATYWRKLRLAPGDYTFCARVENIERPGIAENCGLFNMCATYAISPSPTSPWQTMDTQRFLFTTAGWAAVTSTLAPAGYYVERAGDDITINVYTEPSAHSVYGVWIPPGGGLVVEPGDTAPAGNYAEASETAEGLEIVSYPTESAHSVRGVAVPGQTSITAPSSGYGPDTAVGYPHPQGWRALAYPAAAPGMTAGQIIMILLVEAQARGELPGWGVTFSADLDSSGTPWPERVPQFTCRVGTTYAEVFRQLEEQGYIHWAVSGDSLTLNVWAQSHDFGTQPAVFSDGPGGNIVRLEHRDKWGLKRDKIMARTQNGWVRRQNTEFVSPAGSRQSMISIPDWEDRAKIDAYLDQQIIRTADDASGAALSYVPTTAAVMPFVGFRNFHGVTIPNAVGDPYAPKVTRCVLDEAIVGPPACKVELQSPTKASEELLSRVQARSAPGAFDGRAASIAPYTTSQPQGGELRLVDIKFNLTARADNAATNAISDGLTYADSGDERPPGRFKIQRAQLTAGSLQVDEAPYEGFTIVQLLYNNHVGQTMVLGPGQFQADDYFGSNFVDPRTAALYPFPNWYLETGPLDSVKVQLVSAGTHRNLVYTIWGYEIP